MITQFFRIFPKQLAVILAWNFKH